MGSIGITSGEFRGRSILTPESNLTHPMGAREKIALFNMVANDLLEARVLDAFAGSGALGIEALSRGAKEVVFIEKNPKASKVIVENLKQLGLEEKSMVFVGDIEKYTTDEKFDLIIADPPYDDFRIEKVEYLTKFLEDDGVLVLSHPDDTPIISGLELTKSHKYAGARLSIYRKSA